MNLFMVVHSMYARMNRSDFGTVVLSLSPPEHIIRLDSRLIYVHIKVIYESG
jgi:hypothetical protein